MTLNPIGWIGHFILPKRKRIDSFKVISPSVVRVDIVDIDVDNDVDVDVDIDVDVDVDINDNQ